MGLLDTHTYHVARAILELIYYAASIGIFIVAMLALGQLRIAKQDLSTAVEQLKVAKQDLSTRVERDAASATADQLDAWATALIPKMNDLFAAMDKIGLERLRFGMERFDHQEATTAPAIAVQYAKATELVKANSEIVNQALCVMNPIEASAMCFVAGVADEQIAFLPLSKTYCRFVERMYFVYCMARAKGQLNQYDYTMTLYHKWSQRRAKHDLDAQQLSLSKALEKAEETGKPIKPIGAG